MKLPISTILIIAGLSLLLTDGWFSGQHTVGAIILVVAILRWFLFTALVWLIAWADRPYSPARITRPNRKKRLF